MCGVEFPHRGRLGRGRSRRVGDQDPPRTGWPDRVSGSAVLSVSLLPSRRRADGTAERPARSLERPWGQRGSARRREDETGDVHPSIRAKPRHSPSRRRPPVTTSPLRALIPARTRKLNMSSQVTLWQHVPRQPTSRKLNVAVLSRRRILDLARSALQNAYR